ncbi:UNC93-like protein 3 isoform X1 [Cryptomeria japonica]|uniref:UNC93-like protein 3 isoform X1 n=1 Tax=Cryptomeria japonica TaxID=3369 RepID=UPI0027DA2056|nr:UNC93-like protein 3 isoform X1 [Cryptomeria japonica]
MEGTSNSGTTLSFAVFLGSMILGTILAFFLSKQRRSKAGLGIHHQNSSQSSFKNLLKVTFSLLLDKRMLLLIPLLAYSVLEQEFVWAEFTKFIVKPAIGVAGVGGAMAIFGAADAIVSGPRLPHKKHGCENMLWYCFQYSKPFDKGQTP